MGVRQGELQLGGCREHGAGADSTAEPASSVGRAGAQSSGGQGGRAVKEGG